MSSTADAAGGVGAGEQNPAHRLGIDSGDIVMEIGYAEDCDGALRDGAAALAESALVGEDSDEVVDTTLLWFREDESDLVDVLVDALAPLAEDGQIWLLTPKIGRDGHVEPGEVTESARTAGLQSTSSINACKEWSGTRLVVPKSDRTRR